MNAIITLEVATIVFHSVVRAISHARKKPKAIRRVPIERRIPTSRVRSMTVASTMFMMPMPPTSSEIAVIATITYVKMVCVRCCCAGSAVPRFSLVGRASA